MIKFRTIIFILATTVGLFSVASHTKAATINSSLSNKGGSLTSGLVGWWTFDGADISGTSVMDKSGAGNTGTSSGGVTKVVGKIGQALKFDGSTGYIGSTNNASLQLTSGTLSAWIKTSNSPGDGSFSGIITKQSAYGMFLYANKLATFDWGGVQIRDSGILMNDNKWHHVVEVFQSGVTNGTTFYIDSVLRFTTSMAVSGQVQAVEISRGGPTGGVTQKFTGLIDDVRIYNRMLSAGEVKQLYNQTAGTIAATTVGKGGSLASGLVTHFTFDQQDTAGATVYDKGTGGNNGTIGSGAAKTSGKFGQALNFSGRGAGQDPSFTFGTNVLANINNPFSISGWTFLNGFSKMTYPKMITLDSNGADAAPFEITFANIPGSYLGVLIGSPSTWKRLMTNTPGSSLTKNWHHVVATYNGAGAATAANFKVYIDGVSQTLSTANAYSALTNANTVGTGPTGGSSNAWDGKIDEIRIYNRALSSAEVNKLYALGRTTANKSAAIHPANGGLVGWWTFDGQDMDSTQIYDKSGQNNTGTINGGVTKTIGKLGQALKFDGSTGYVNTGSAASLNAIWTSLTVSAWIRFSAAPSGVQGSIVSKGAAAGSNNFNLDLETDRRIRFWFGGAPVLTYSASSLSTGNWHFVTGVWDGTKNIIYVDGKQDGTPIANTPTVSASGSPVYIGIWNVDSTFAYMGNIDDTRIYNRALSAAEIKQLYNATK